MRVGVGNIVNAIVYIAVALGLRMLGVPAVGAYLWPVPVIVLVWLIIQRERRVR